jgi:hypothetical protein
MIKLVRDGARKLHLDSLKAVEKFSVSYKNSSSGPFWEYDLLVLLCLLLAVLVSFIVAVLDSGESPN